MARAMGVNMLTRVCFTMVPINGVEYHNPVLSLLERPTAMACALLGWYRLHRQHQPDIWGLTKGMIQNLYIFVFKPILKPIPFLV
jgi:hypothetical protein